MSTESAIKEWIVARIARIAPEVQIDQIDPRVSFRDQFEFDSVDFLNFVLSLEEQLKIRIPEVDYPKLSSLEGCEDYLAPYLGQVMAAG